MKPVLSVSAVTVNTASLVPAVAPATGWYGSRRQSYGRPKRLRHQ